MGNDKDAKLDDIPIVRDYPDVYLDELPRLLPKLKRKLDSPLS